MSAILLSIFLCFSQVSEVKQEATLYYLPSCPYSKEVLDYLQKTHRTISLKNLQNNPQGRDELKRVGGELRVPCLVVDNKAIYGASNIIEWLDENPVHIETANFIDWFSERQMSLKEPL